MKAIVTGSHGFIGRALVHELDIQGYEVYEYDIKNGDDVTKLNDVPKVDEIYHLAATNGTKLFYDQPADVLKNNTLLTFAFDNYMLLNPNTRFIFSSTCEVFNGAVDQFGWEVPTAEDVPAVFCDLSNPRWSYSLPKALAENYYQNAYSNVSIIRYFNIFGEGQVDHFISEFIERSIKQGIYRVYGNDTRSFCYVKDAAAMTVNIGKNGSGVYNIGREQEDKIEDIAKFILRTLEISEQQLEIYQGKEGSASRRCPSMKRYNEQFGAFEYTNFNKAMENTIAWNLKELEKSC